FLKLEGKAACPLEALEGGDLAGVAECVGDHHPEELGDRHAPLAAGKRQLAVQVIGCKRRRVREASREDSGLVGAQGFHIGWQHPLDIPLSGRSRVVQSVCPDLCLPDKRTLLEELMESTI